jgi:pyruvate/2-oxoacid:ferredoxin oxidoreductase alpha subunit
MKQVLMGDHAVSHAVRLCRAQVISAYPITPQTFIVEEISEMCADGRLDARFVMVESEHSAMACVIGASAAGSRAFTATSSHGLALMHEVLHWAAGARLPIVMANVNRTLGPPWNILCDHSDSMAQRDTGWIQFYVETNQEALDTIIQGFRIAEQVLLPVMVNLDGFFLSHTTEVVDVPEEGAVDTFLPPYQAEYKLDVEDPVTMGAMCLDEKFMGLRYGQQDAMDEALRIAAVVDDEYGKNFGRSYGLTETYRTEDAAIILVTAGTITGTARVVIDRLRDEGQAVGLLRIRLLRPFPCRELRDALQHAERIAVIDRSVSLGLGGGLASEIRAALYGIDGRHPPIFGFVAGLGGKDVVPEDILEIVRQTGEIDKPPREDIWIGV